MEDISRDLEREIESYLRTGTSKKKSERMLLFVDEAGEMKSAEWIRKAVYVLSFIVVIMGAMLFFYYHRYTNIKGEYHNLKEQLIQAGSKIDSLTEEKELLMAKVVMSGKKLPLREAGNGRENFQKDMKTDDLASQKGNDTDKMTPAGGKSESRGNSIDDTGDTAAEKKGETSSLPGDIDKGVVAIDRFTVREDDNTGDLLLRFRINNTDERPGDSSGYIFVRLYSSDMSDTDPLIVPTVTLENGVPGQYRKGQYFSISRFKPVKFRIKNQPDPDFFTEAVVFVFNTEGEMCLRKKISLTGPDSN